MGTAFWSAGSQLVEGCENGIRMYAGQEALRELTETVNGRISDDMDLSKFKLLAVDGAGSITLISQSLLLDSTELPFWAILSASADFRRSAKKGCSEHAPIMQHSSCSCSSFFVCFSCYGGLCLTDGTTAASSPDEYVNFYKGSWAPAMKGMEMFLQSIRSKPRKEKEAYGEDGVCSSFKRY